MRALGIRTVIDLRSASELERGRSTSTRTRSRSTTSPSSRSSPTPRSSTAGPGCSAPSTWRSCATPAPRSSRVLEVLAPPDALPAVFHCTAGKDRTGVLSALVLSLLGVDEPTVVADYALSGAAMLRLRAKLILKYPEGRETLENIDEVFSADPAQMELLLDHLRDQYGSVEAYVAGFGRRPGLIGALRAALLEPALRACAVRRRRRRPGRPGAAGRSRRPGPGPAG